MRRAALLAALLSAAACAAPVPSDAEAPAMTAEEYAEWKVTRGPAVAASHRDQRALSICQNQVPPIILGPGPFALVGLAAMAGTAGKRSECWARYQATGDMPIPEGPAELPN